MMTMQRRVRVARLAAIALVVMATTSYAQTTAETACRNAIAKNLGKFVSTAFRDLTGCHRKRSAGRIPLSTECNDVFSIPDNKTVKAYEKASAAMLAACPDTLTGVLSQFARCPSPHSTLDDDDATAGIDNFDEATGCVLNLAATLANGATATILGAPDVLPSSGAAKCQRAVGRALRKRIVTIAKVRRTCQYGNDRDGGGIGYDCGLFDDGRIGDNLADTAEDIAKACDVPKDELAVLESCGQTVAQLQTCAGGISTVLGGGLVAEAYEMPATCNLGFAILSVNAGSGEKITQTQFELGYNGFGHSVDLLDEFKMAVNLSCNSDCVDCDVTLNPVKPLPISFCRCDSDPTIHCDTINGADADDCGGGGCSCMFAPPLPLSASSVPACVVNEFASQLDGTADGGTGVATVALQNTAVVHLGDSATRPCPVCLGDIAPDDGARNGTCSGGVRDGLPCDENASSPDFGPVSYECLPLPGNNISGAGLKLKFALTSVDAPTLGTNLIDGAKEVYCLQCSGDPLVGCSSDAECAAVSAGTCSVNTGPQAHANACDDSICTASGPTANGVCAANALDRFCDGITRNDGSGLLSCADNADCSALDAACPGSDCGNCELLQQRSCFPDPLGAVGSDGLIDSIAASGVYGADMVGTLCVPPTANNTINNSVGLPGPARLLLNFDFLGRCGSNPSLSYELPGGSNCP